MLIPKEITFANRTFLNNRSAIPITKEATKGLKTASRSEKRTYLRATYIATVELAPTMAYPTAAPTTEYFSAKIGRKIQVNAVHIIIRKNVILILPMAFRRLV